MVSITKSKAARSDTGGGGVWRCAKCESNFSTSELLAEHKARNCMKEDKSFLCPICNMFFARKYNRDQHISSHTKDVPCRICALSFRSENALQTHLTSSHEVAEINNYKNLPKMHVECPSCPTLFRSYYELYFHEQDEHETKAGSTSVTCDKCEKFFPNRRQLDSHKKLKHSKTMADRTCIVCEKVFASKQALELHTRIHTGDKPIKCPDCEETFRCASLLKQHRVVAHVKNMFVCLICNQTFTRSNRLQDHLKNHLSKEAKK